MKKSVLHRLLCATTGLGLFALAGGAQALIAAGEPSKGGNTPELVLWMFDPVKEISFTKDLGVYVAPFNRDLDNSKNFFVQAQQDGGYQKFFDPLNGDANFVKFRDASGDPKNMLWGIYAASDVDFFGPGSFNFFTTLKSTDTNGVVNPRYTSLMAADSQRFSDFAYTFGRTYMGDLNSGRSSTGGAGPLNPDNSHYKDIEISDPAEYLLYNGSSFDQKGIEPYLVFYTQGNLEGAFSGVIPPTLNPVGASSWFYYMTRPESNKSDALVVIDEFDNLTHDGYWGLAVDAKGDYILSFTMEGTVAKPTTVPGLARRNLTDFSALYGGVRSLSAPANEFIGWMPSSSQVNAVPEPATYGLFGLGLAALVWRTRRRSA